MLNRPGLFVHSPKDVPGGGAALSNSTAYQQLLSESKQ